MTGAVVVGASYRSLAVVRSLGRRGVPVHVVQTDDHTLALRSRYATSTSHSDQEPDSLAAHLVDLTASGERVGWVLIPTHDEEAMAIALARDRLDGRYRLTTPTAAALRPSYDKRALAQLACELGIDQPWTFAPRGAEDLEGLVAPYPIVIKPAWKRTLNPLTIDKAWPVSTPAELAARYGDACQLVSPEAVLLQERIPGEDAEQLSVAILARSGVILATVTARRARQYPRTFGRASTFVETIADDPALSAAVANLVSAMDFTGIAEVEFMRDPRDGRTLLLDMNPRAWGWISLCGRAGVDFPWLLYRLARGEGTLSPDARPGVRWVRMSTDLAVALPALRNSSLRLDDWLRSIRPPCERAVFAWDDPVPSLVAPVAAASLLARRKLRHPPERQGQNP